MTIYINHNLDVGEHPLSSMVLLGELDGLFELAPALGPTAALAATYLAHDPDRTLFDLDDIARLVGAGNTNHADRAIRRLVRFKILEPLHQMPDTYTLHHWAPRLTPHRRTQQQ